LLKAPSTTEEGEGQQQPQQKQHTCSLLVAQWAQFIYEDISRIGTNHLFPSGQQK
jgi:hypothetical protein